MVNKKGGFQNTSIGILILRVGLGVMMILHGYPKLFGGPEMWAEVGAAARYIGIDVLPVFFGFLAGIIEFLGGIFLIFGLFFRTTLCFLIALMIVAAASHLGQGNPFGLTSHPIELLIVFAGLFFMGHGKYSLDKTLKNQSRRRRY